MEIPVKDGTRMQCCSCHEESGLRGVAWVWKIQFQSCDFYRCLAVFDLTTTGIDAQLTFTGWKLHTPHPVAIYRFLFFGGEKFADHPPASQLLSKSIDPLRF